MEVALAGLIGLFFSAAAYLLLSKAIIRMLLGVAILGNGVNLLIFTIGRLTAEVPPIVPASLSSRAMSGAYIRAREHRKRRELPFAGRHQLNVDCPGACPAKPCPRRDRG